MGTEPGLLSAITANRGDDTARLVYADWLDEHGDPSRAAYLRLQVELVRSWWYDNPCDGVYPRLAGLAGGLDAGWLAAVRRCTTPAPPVNVEGAMPDLRGRAKTAVRLHPRSGEAAVDASKVGGVFLWPAREQWPICPVHGNLPYVTALQLRKEDVPELGFPAGTDLFQLLWCPEQHDEDDTFCPRPAAYWRNRRAVKQPLRPMPEPVEVPYGHIPRPCVLYPERVTDYPDSAELGNSHEQDENPMLRAAVVSAAGRLPAVSGYHLPGSGSHLYEAWLGAAAGTKVGGYPDWVQHPHCPRCGCGAEMQHLLSFASWEWDGVSWGRWLPVEDRPALAADHREQDAVCSAHGCMFGDAGNMYVFVCRGHREPQVRAFMQCG
jgi:uncharacterized protein (TIGR02996 family)